MGYIDKRLLLGRLLSFRAELPLQVPLQKSAADYIYGGAGGQVQAIPYFDINKTNCVGYGVFSYLGGTNSFCLLNNLNVNQLGISKFPVVGKYLGGAGYPMANMNVIIDNQIVSPDLLLLVPAEILRNIPKGYKIDFYTEILSWDPIVTDPSGILFEDKVRQFNLIFHGAMIDWFSDKYKEFNFSMGGVSENLNLGIFNFDGISKIDQMGSNSLNLQPVNPHNGHFSPDNARFTVQHDRNLITGWSVASSDQKQRAMITYHVLINQAAYPDLLASIDRTTKNALTLEDLIAGLKSTIKIDGVDGEAWRKALFFLGELYSF